MDDFALLARWRDGDGRALDTLVRRYDPTLEDFLRHKTGPDDCEDLKQQVWEALTRSPPREVRRTFRSYLFGVARHFLIRYYERKRRQAAWDERSISLAELDTTLTQRLARKLGAQHLLVALQQLPIADQLLLEMMYYYELSIAELAEIHAVPAGTIKSRLSHARERLRAAWPHGRLRP
jgi:RNA polymerase sigma-70 factor (ECF subfamily)